VGEDETEYIFATHNLRNSVNQHAHLRAHEICEKTIQISHFRRGVSAEKQTEVRYERPRKIPITQKRSIDNINPSM
jgi:hypothetical protein